MNPVDIYNLFVGLMQSAYLLMNGGSFSFDSVVIKTHRMQLNTNVFQHHVYHFMSNPYKIEMNIYTETITSRKYGMQFRYFSEIQFSFFMRALE